MIEFRGQKILSTSLTLSLIVLQPLQAATGLMNAAPMEGSADAPAAASEMPIASNVGDIPTTQSVSHVMGGITFPKTPVTMDFQEADIRDVLHLLAVKSGMNIIYGIDVTGNISIHLDQVPFDQAFQTVLTLKGLVALPMGPKIIRVVTSTGLTTEQSQAATFTRVFRLNYASADDIKKPVDAIRSAAGRKGVSTTDSKTNSLIITDTQEGLKEVEDLIPALDKKPTQVDIEAKIVEVSLDNHNSMGISWAFARTAGGGNYYGGSVAQTGTTGGAGQSIPGTTPNGPNGTSGIPFTGVNLFTDDAAGALNQVGFSYLHSEAAYLLSTQLTALAASDRLKVLSNPHIVATNNEEASINVVDNIPYQTSNITSGGTTSTNFSFIQAGVKLTVKPTVNADRRITLKVKPEVSNKGTAPFAGAPPDVNTRDAETTVVLRDGETIAIGGLITESTEKIVNGIPFLMSIPILGYLFKTTDDIKERDELIVFLTPKIAGE